MTYKQNISIFGIVARKRAEHSYLVNARVETYSSHVLDRLVGIKGRDRSDVAAFIIRSWIAEHREELTAYGISAKVKNGNLRIR